MSVLSWQAYLYFVLAVLAWREARGAGEAAIIAVIWTVINRTRHPKWWGDDEVEVATKKWQYSAMAAPKDKQLIIWPQLGDPIFARCMQLVQQIYAGIVPHPLPRADSYYDDSIPLPVWATPDKFVGKIANLSFYNIDNDTGD